ncbi:DUF4199 domain-containing protein [Pontibacter ruber]|uniref:DUF4199 domain-containing protein n=1 Tax=Pontibacter ruber TaxID=1343895 RepID=A0ABW5CYQ3_9BACT|nr:DUF4199 domain-containing protein [Pontibacter ruber]
MTENQPSVTSVALKYGFVGALVSIVYTAVLMIAGAGTNKWLGGLGYLILIVAIFVAMQQYKKQNAGFMSYGQGLGIGTLVSLIFGLLGGLFMFVYTTFIDPNYMAGIMDQQRMELEERGFSDEQIDQAMAMGESFQGPVMTILSALIGYVIIGFILSLIISAIMKNKRPEFI